MEEGGRRREAGGQEGEEEGRGGATSWGRVVLTISSGEGYNELRSHALGPT